MADGSDDESVSHVSNSISDSEEMCDSPTFSFLEDAIRELDELAEMYEPPSHSEEMCDSPSFSFLEEAIHELDELAQMHEPPPQLEEEDTELYPPEEAAYRSRNWTEACQWCASDNMFERVAYNLTPYFLPILNLGKDYPDGPNKVSLWDGGDIVTCDRIADIMKLRPRPGCTRDQMRIEYVKGWVSNLHGDDTGKWITRKEPWSKFRLYDGSNSIHVTLWNDHNTHANVTEGVLREGCVVVLYWVACFIRDDATPGHSTHRLSGGFSNILVVFS